MSDKNMYNHSNNNYNKYGHLKLRNPNQKLHYSKEEDEKHAYSLTVNTNLTTKNHQKDHDQDKRHSNKQYILSFNTYNSINNEHEINNFHHHKGTHAFDSL